MLRFGAVGVIVAFATLPYLWAFLQKHSRLGVSDGSAAARLVTWQRAIATFWENRWFGIGFNTYGFVQEHRGFERTGGSASYSAEGGLLFIAVMTGIVGLLVYGAMLWYVMRKCRAVWRDRAATPEQRGLAIGAAAATIAICVHSIFVNSLLTPYVMEPLWVLWGLAFVIATTLQRQKVEVLAA
jgi:O-antigen ligase